MSTIAVLGAGAWGTALATGLASGGHRVTLCARRTDHLTAMRARRENAEYLPGVALPQSIELSGSWTEAAGVSGTVAFCASGNDSGRSVARRRHDAHQRYQGGRG